MIFENDVTNCNPQTFPLAGDTNNLGSGDGEFLSAVTNLDPAQALNLSSMKKHEGVCIRLWNVGAHNITILNNSEIEGVIAENVFLFPDGQDFVLAPYLSKLFMWKSHNGRTGWWAD